MNLSEEKTMHDKHKFELIYSQDVIAARIKELGEQISEDYRDREPGLIGVLTGCILFLENICYLMLPVCKSILHDVQVVRSDLVL